MANTQPTTQEVISDFLVRFQNEFKRTLDDGFKEYNIKGKSKEVLSQPVKKSQRESEMEYDLMCYGLAGSDDKETIRLLQERILYMLGDITSLRIEVDRLNAWRKRFSYISDSPTEKSNG